MNGRALEIGGVFLPLSLATIGGGQSAISGIRHQVVDVHHWMTAQQFVEAFAISRMAPGPGSLLVTLIGWRVDGLIGALIATLAIFAPTSLLVFGVAKLWSRHQGARWQVALQDGLRPVAAGLVLAASYALIMDLSGGIYARLIVACATGVLMLTRVPALVLLGVGAAAGAGLSIAGLLH
jgi:chromate transporter